MIWVAMVGSFVAGFAACLVVVGAAQNGWRAEFEQERQAVLESVRRRVN